MTQSNKKATDTRGLAFYNSDTDDWTLVSPPSSSGGSSRSSSSPEGSPERNLSKEIERNAQQQSQTTQESSTISTEVSLSSLTTLVHTDNSSQSSSCEEAQTKKQTSHKTSTSTSSSAKMVLDGANRSERADDADDESDGMTEVNLDENGFAIIREQPITNFVQFSSIKNDCTDDNEQKNDDNNRSKSRVIKSTRSNQVLSVVQDLEGGTHEFKLKSEKVKTPIESTMQKSPSPKIIYKYRLPTGSEESAVGLALGMVIGALICIAYGNMTSPDNYYSRILSNRLSNNTFDFLYSDPSNHAYTELKLLNEEIADCIERRNPITLEVAHWRLMDQTELSKYETMMNSRPFKGLVCYENEVKWRKRYNYLKTEFNFDLRKLIRQIKHRLTNDILAKYHPHTPFELVLNQLEYLDYVEQRRKDNALEKLKAENLDLSRRLNNRSFSGQEKKDNESILNRQKRQSRSTESQDQPSIKSLIILESENVRLRREVESLKSRLAEKAGTVYIKQSIELEKCERDNNIFKQFHQDVADEIGKNLLKVGLHRTEAFTYMTTNNKDDDNTSAKLASTRHFFMKLSEAITKLVDKNTDLERDLSEAKMLNALVVREAQNLIEGANQTKSQGDESPMDNNNQARQINASDDHLTRYREYEPEAGKTSGRFNSNVVPNDASTTEFSKERETNDSDQSDPLTMHKDWLSKRAQLREQLRQSSRALERHLSDFRRSPRSLSTSTSSSSSDYEHNNVRLQQSFQNRWEKKDPGTQYEHHQIHHSKSRFNDIEHKRLDSLKRLNKFNKSSKSSSTKANSYNQNSQKNCKSHHKRDEL